MGQDKHGHYEPDDALGAQVDDDLHRALTAAYPTTYEATAAYDELRPTLIGNRRRQLVRQGATATAAVALIMLGGSLALSRLTSPASDSNIIAGPASGEATDGVTGDGEPSNADLPVTSMAGGTTQGGESAAAGDSPPAVLPEAGTTAGPSDDPAPASTIPGADPVVGESAPTASPAVSSSAIPSTSEAVPTPTTVPATAATIFESVCGSVSYTVDGRDLALVEAIAANGGEADIKSAGPQNIEVSFEGGGDHCEVKVEWKNGTLVADDDHEASGGESE